MQKISNIAKSQTLQKVDYKHLESFETWRWRKMEKIMCYSRLRNEVVLYRDMEKKNIVHTMKRRRPDRLVETSCEARF